jgi:hypothetical protein
VKKTFTAALIVAMCVGFGLAVKAAVSTTFVITPVSPVFDSNHVTGVMLDGAPGFLTGSFKSDGIAKTDMYFAPENVFGHAVKVGEVESISYWTKKGSTHAQNPIDWALVLYTKPFTGSLSTSPWYGERLGAEPYFAMSTIDPADTWNQWSSDAGDNQLRFYESTAGAPGANFGTYNDPTWDVLKVGNGLSGQPYAGHDVLYFSVQTGSGTAAGFTGQVDGVRIELTNGEVVNLNFEPFLQPTDRDACKKGGFASLLRGNGLPFANQGDCVSYVNTGK